MSDILYLKLDKNIQIKSAPVCLGDIAQISCSTKPVENKVKVLKLPTPSIKGPGRYIFSIMDVLAVIEQEYPNLEVSNLGEADFVLTVEKEHPLSDVMSWGKTVLVCILSFFGAAFSIMAFNNDIDITKLFGHLYEMFTGEQSNGFTLLEISYSIGVGLGILIFFHHFARKKNASDPTPLEVEMRTYEDQVDTTLIEAKGRNSRKQG